MPGDPNAEFWARFPATLRLPPPLPQYPQLPQHPQLPRLPQLPTQAQQHPHAQQSQLAAEATQENMAQIARRMAAMKKQLRQLVAVRHRESADSRLPDRAVGLNLASTSDTNGLRATPSVESAPSESVIEGSSSRPSPASTPTALPWPGAFGTPAYRTNTTALASSSPHPGQAQSVVDIRPTQGLPGQSLPAPRHFQEQLAPFVGGIWCFFSRRQEILQRWWWVYTYTSSPYLDSELCCLWWKLGLVSKNTNSLMLFRTKRLDVYFAFAFYFR